MKRDWLKQQLGDAATDELVDAIMAKNGSDVNAAKAQSEALREKLEAADARVAELAAEADGKLSEAERGKKELEAANKRAERAIRELNEAKAAAILAGAGLSEEEYSPLLAGIVTSEKDKTIANAQALADLVSARVNAAVERSGREALANMKGPEAGASANGLPATASEFMALSYERQLELKRDNPSILSQLK
ncbi:DUF4355 domain-containing protein [Collinsella sp. AGMB00827]|uniref:DUF4355 domain-containing protein n=1 Tax=Collinsella ureilytica TaxID=2869515 RepID=A0ABS7MLV9_9ACTN|nr:DUF4355 domain-containing protein [Collinsella urealyticum]MBY4798346.1 DUF4355 domain-containing protein [Collinsella urealyticum]